LASEAQLRSQDSIRALLTSAPELDELQPVTEKKFLLLQNLSDLLVVLPQEDLQMETEDMAISVADAHTNVTMGR
jgi:hypothetical protein